MRSRRSFVLLLLRKISNAHSVKNYQQAASGLKEKDEWKADISIKFSNYVTKTWLLVDAVSDVLKYDILNSSEKPMCRLTRDITIYLWNYFFASFP